MISTLVALSSSFDLVGAFYLHKDTYSIQTDNSNWLFRKRAPSKADVLSFLFCFLFYEGRGGVGWHPNGFLKLTLLRMNQN